MAILYTATVSRLQRSLRNVAPTKKFDDMIENAWDEYRSWAKRARELQTSSQRWTRAAMIFALLAAIFGVAAGQVGAGSWGRLLAFLAAASAAITPVLGQDLLSIGRESQWIRARATAESIKSECFRYAARSGDYATPAAVVRKVTDMLK